MNTEKYRQRERERHRGGHTDRQIDGRERERERHKQREIWILGEIDRETKKKSIASERK